MTPQRWSFLSLVGLMTVAALLPSAVAEAQSPLTYLADGSVTFEPRSGTVLKVAANGDVWIGGERVVNCRESPGERKKTSSGVAKCYSGYTKVEDADGAELKVYSDYAKAAEASGREYTARSGSGAPGGQGGLLGASSGESLRQTLGRTRSELGATRSDLEATRSYLGTLDVFVNAFDPAAAASPEAVAHRRILDRQLGLVARDLGRELAVEVVGARVVMMDARQGTAVLVVEVAGESDQVEAIEVELELDDVSTALGDLDDASRDMAEARSDMAGAAGEVGADLANEVATVFAETAKEKMKGRLKSAVKSRF